MLQQLVRRPPPGRRRRAGRARARRAHGARPRPGRRATRPRARSSSTLSDALLELPEGFTVHPKLGPQLERRRVRDPRGRHRLGPRRGARLRIAAGRRHRDPPDRTGHRARHVLAPPPRAARRAHRRALHADAARRRRSKARFEVHNSPLSETACLGFEYGYSVTRRNALVIWEAQFGDFANGAQVIIDQFIASGRSKWGVTSRLTLFLPHGYEGNGPEHSSARLERFLQLAADDNLRIANVTTPAQLYHLLRRQAIGRTRRPLVVMTPKGLLRLKESLSALGRLHGRHVPADHRRPGRRRLPRGHQPPRALLGPPLLRPPAPRRARKRRRGRDRAHRAALPVPDGRADRAAGGLHRAQGDRLGPGGAGQHGRLALGAPPRRGGRAARRAAELRGPPVARQPVRGLHVRALPRAGPHRAGRARRCRCRRRSPAPAGPTPPDSARVRSPRTTAAGHRPYPAKWHSRRVPLGPDPCVAARRARRENPACARAQRTRDAGCPRSLDRRSRRAGVRRTPAGCQVALAASATWPRQRSASERAWRSFDQGGPASVGRQRAAKWHSPRVPLGHVSDPHRSARGARARGHARRRGRRSPPAPWRACPGRRCRCRPRDPSCPSSPGRPPGHRSRGLRAVGGSPRIGHAAASPVRGQRTRRARRAAGRVAACSR